MVIAYVYHDVSPATIINLLIIYILTKILLQLLCIMNPKFSELKQALLYKIYIFPNVICCHCPLSKFLAELTIFKSNSMRYIASQDIAIPDNLVGRRKTLKMCREHE